MGIGAAAGSVAGSVGGDNNTETDPYAGLMKDADKLKLMLLAWNYQNSNAVRNGTEGPDLGVVGGLWAQYQNALAQNAANNKMDISLSPVPRTDVTSPMEAQDETNSSGQKEEDEGSEDDSDDKLDEKLATHDPERLKAFNVSIRVCVLMTVGNLLICFLYFRCSCAYLWMKILIALCRFQSSQKRKYKQSLIHAHDNSPNLAIAHANVYERI